MFEFANGVAEFGGSSVDSDLAKVIKDDSRTICRLLSRGSNNADALEAKHGLAAAGALIKYLDLLSDDSYSRSFSLTEFNPNKYLKLDNAALRALNVFHQPGDSLMIDTPPDYAAHKSHCLYGLLNKCKTAVGSRLLQRWLKQPLVSADEIDSRLDAVEAFVLDTSTRQLIMVPQPL